MYHCKLNIFILSDTKQLQQELEKLPPFERFTHHFTTNSSVREAELETADLLIVSLGITCSELKKTLGRFRNHMKENAELIAVLDFEQYEQCDAMLLSMLDDVWVSTQHVEMLRFHFAKYQRRAKERTDAWLTGNYLETTINGVEDLVWYKDKHGSHLKVNDEFCNVVHKTKKQIEGRGHYYIWDIEPEEYKRGEYVCLESEYEVMGQKKTCVFDEKVKTREGLRRLRTYKSPLFDLDGSIMGTVGVAHDVTTEYLQAEKLRKNTMEDLLTGLYNRRYLYTYLEEHKEEPLDILFIDLDHFKEVNTIFGHLEGDNMLAVIAELMKQTFPEAVIARVGGDEFIVVMRGQMSLEELRSLADTFIGKLEKQYEDISSLKKITASIGIAQNARGQMDVNELMEAGHRAMLEYRQEKEKSDEYDQRTKQRV
jgi:diguanylate cyclase (GGDEF)-like protein/PAS domain S-box-containing protein